MNEVDREIREAAGRFEPPPGWLDRIGARARRRRRNKQILATTVGIAVRRTSHRDVTPGDAAGSASRFPPW
jgi:hypothetical protein